jgi:hypothetical protein
MGFFASQHDDNSRKIYHEAIPRSRLAIKDLATSANVTTAKVKVISCPLGEAKSF